MVADRLLDVVRDTQARVVIIVGTAKNVGKTVTARALLDAAERAGFRVAFASVGRDGEGLDALDDRAKPTLAFRPGTFVATAREALARTPATAVRGVLGARSALGRVVVAQVREPGLRSEIAGSPTASGLRATLDALDDLAAPELTIVDGAIDRIAALAGGEDAIVVATGAAAATTPAAAAALAGNLVARLRTPRVDPTRPSVAVDGALTAERLGAFLDAGETRQIVVRDPTQILVRGAAFARAASRVEIRCERPLRPLACTVASASRERRFDPRALVEAVAAATHLPTVDLYSELIVA